MSQPHPYPHRRPSRNHLPFYILGGAVIALSVVVLVLLGSAVAGADPDADLSGLVFVAVMWALLLFARGLPVLALGAIVQVSDRNWRRRAGRVESAC